MHLSRPNHYRWIRFAFVASLVLSTGGAGVANADSAQSGASTPQSVGGHYDSGVSRPQPVAAHYDGETLYRGLYFAQGPVAELFPDVPRPTTSAARTAAINAIVNRVRTQHPEFFAEFALAMQSGNRVKIRAALDNADAVTREAVRSLGVANATSGRSNGECIEINIFGFEVLVVFLEGVAVVDTAAVLEAFFFLTPQEGSQQAPLARSQWIDRIAKTLGN